MVNYHIDLNAQIISAEKKIYVARPGRRYALYLNFLEQSIIFPELPFLDLDASKPFSEQENLDSRILRARAIRNWYRNPEGKELPSRNIDDYKEIGGDRSLGQLRGVVSGYFQKMAQGDLVVVPPSSFSQDALIGELTAPPSVIVNAAAQHYGDEIFQGRSVKWLARIPKRRLPSQMLGAIEKPSALYILEKSLRYSIYEAAYGSYIDLSSSDPLYTSRFNISSDDYNTQDDFRLLAFMNLIAANLKSFESGGEFRGLFDSISSDLGGYAPDLRTNVNSPGYITISSNFGTPIIATVLFMLALTAGAAALDAGTKITIGNSKAPAGDQCTAMVDERAKGTLDLLGLDGWPSACEAARKAAAAAGITTTTNVTVQP